MVTIAVGVNGISGARIIVFTRSGLGGGRGGLFAGCAAITGRTGASVTCHTVSAGSAIQAWARSAIIYVDLAFCSTVTGRASASVTCYTVSAGSAIQAWIRSAIIYADIAGRAGPA
jgi:hypothetical protein